MCTLVILSRPDHDWPLILGANRDESLSRPWDAPARHWPDRDDVVAGRDRLAGGSWMGLNDHGVAAAILNRHASLGPLAGKRSRGELVLEALDHADAVAAGEAIGQIDPHAYRPFNLVIGDDRDAVIVIHRGVGPVETVIVPPGLHLITSGELDDPESKRISRYRQHFAMAPSPDEDPEPWTRLLADDVAPPDEPAAAMCFRLPGGFGTVSSSILLLPARGSSILKPSWLFRTIDENGQGPMAPVRLD